MLGNDKLLAQIFVLNNATTFISCRVMRSRSSLLAVMFCFQQTYSLKSTRMILFYKFDHRSLHKLLAMYINVNNYSQTRKNQLSSQISGLRINATYPSTRKKLNIGFRVSVIRNFVRDGLDKIGIFFHLEFHEITSTQWSKKHRGGQKYFLSVFTIFQKTSQIYQSDSRSRWTKTFF